MDQQRTTNILLVSITAIAIVIGFKLAQPVLLVLLLSVLLAYIMDPVMMALKRIGLSLFLAVLITGLFFLGIFFGAGTIIISNLISFGRRFPTYQNELMRWLDSLAGQIETLTGGNISLDLIEEVGKLPIGSYVINTTTYLASNISLLVLILFFAILFLSEKYYLPRKLAKVFAGRRAPRSRSKLPVILKHIDENLRKFLVVRTLISLAVGVSSGFALFLFGVEFAIIWGLLTFLLNFIPNIGSFISMVVPFLFSFVQYAGTPTPFLILLSLAFCQFITGVLMEPKFMGDTLNISLFFVFLSMFFWGWLWGAAGVLLAVPMTTSIKIILKNIPATSRYATLLEKLPTRRRLIHLRRKLKEELERLKQVSQKDES
jgi:predicted PurR-regulated permease PerM